MIDHEVARYAPIIAIPVTQLGISKPHLVRPIDDTYVCELVDTDADSWDPIEVRLWPDEWTKPSPEIEYHVISGNHRTSAACIKKLETLQARIIEASSELDCMVAGIRTNARHGRNFTNNEKRALAAKLRDLGQPSREIARLFGVDKSTINNWLSGRDSNASKKAREYSPVPGELDEAWQVAPSADSAQCAKVGSKISDFLAESPIHLAPAHVAAWIEQLLPEKRQAEAENVDALIQWLTNFQLRLKGLHG